MNNQNLAIGILSVTATILLVGLILLGTMTQQEAKGFAQIDRGGDYIMLTSQFRSSKELLWILDARSQIMGMYYFDPQRVRLELVGTLDFGTR
jgi:hypothetical protein